MKIFKYVVALVAILSMTFSFTSCSKDVNPDVDAKQWYLIEFAVASQGSLTDAEVALFDAKVTEVIYAGQTDRYPMFVTSDYAYNSFNTIAGKGKNSDVQKKVVNAIVKETGKKDFQVSMTMYSYSCTLDDNANPQFERGLKLAEHIFNASDAE